ncbi:MAG: DUF1351 domain-containing protein [Vallitaleaceae bacterium]|nr:DUF1351 domain-containing protein [Vallitaleaceae bacterium]
MSQELITVTQLPVIEERLQSISETIQAQTEKVLSLAVTEDTYKQIKKRRTELTKRFNLLEDQRKAVKQKVMAPYDAFEEVYKKYVTDIFKPADTKLKSRIDEVEKTLLENKKKEVATYFQEASAAQNIDFVTFDDIEIKVLFSDSMKKLREQVDNALEKITGELAVIATLDYPEEILVEYKDNLNLTKSVLTVKNRKERLAAELQRKAKTQMSAPIARSMPSPEPITPVANDPEPEATPLEAAPEVATMAEPECEPEQSLITIIIKAHSCEEVMTITEICKARRLEYTIS